MLSLPIAAKVLRDLGPAWVLKRIAFAAQNRAGLLKRRMPAGDWNFDSVPLLSDLTADPEAFKSAVREQSRFFFSADQLPSPMHAGEVCQQAERVLNGEWPYFAHTWLRVGVPPDWHFNALNGTRVADSDHWSDIELYSIHDVKFVWEPSRFAVVYLLVRAYAARTDDRYAEGFWRLVEDWADKNPPNRGVNWASGQELALRVMAWCFGLHAFLNSPTTTAQRLGRLICMIERHGERIAAFIDYALSQRNNHGISEAVGLFTIGTLFPHLSRASQWRKKGRGLIIAQAPRQVYEDGSYVQHSFNYERVLIDNLVWATRLGEVNDCWFPDETYECLGTAVQFMLRFCDPESGRMPNYGSNDGSLVLPLTSCDFTDYRPALQAANFLVYGQFCFGNGGWNEQLEWLFANPELEHESKSPRIRAMLVGPEGKPRSPSGYNRLTARESYVMLRAATLIDRPVQADQLHLDLWWRGENIACDAGTYLYNGAPPWDNGLAHTAVHNSVTVGERDQMTRVDRFLWVDWAQAQSFRYQIGSFGRVLEACHDGYAKATAKHKRSVLYCECEDFWIVIDDVVGASCLPTRLHWLFANFPYEWSPNELQLSLHSGVGRFRCTVCAPRASTATLVRAGKVVGTTGATLNEPVHEILGWRAAYYGEKEPALSLAIQTRSRLPVRFVTILAPDDVSAFANTSRIQLARAGVAYSVVLNEPGAERTFSKLERSVHGEAQVVTAKSKATAHQT